MRPNLITRLKEEWNNLDPVDPLRGLIADAIDALAEQPAQQQEPVAWPEHEFIQWGAKKYGPLLRAAIALLAEVENNLDTKDTPQKFGVPFGKLVALRAAIETSPPAQQQEPVAERFEAMHANGDVWITTIAAAAIARTTSPPASKPWVGLTKEDRYKAIRPLYCDDETAALAACHSNDEYEAIEAKLRGKNA